MELVQCYCGSVFNDQDISDHIQIFHLDKNETLSGYTFQELKTFFQDLFPDYDIHTESGSSASFTLNLVKDNTRIEQIIGTSFSNQFPNTLEAAAAEVIGRIHLIQHITTQTGLLGCFETFHCHEFLYKNHLQNSYFTFRFTLKENPDEVITKQYFPHQYSKNDKKQKQYLDDFIADFRQYFVSELEGTLEKIEDSGYFNGYSINGIPCEHLLFSSSTVRVEIIE